MKYALAILAGLLAAYLLDSHYRPDTQRIVCSSGFTADTPSLDIESGVLIYSPGGVYKLQPGEQCMAVTLGR